MSSKPTIKTTPAISGAGTHIINTPLQGKRYTLMIATANVTTISVTNDEDPDTTAHWKPVDLTVNDITNTGYAMPVFEADVSGIRVVTSGAAWWRLTIRQ